MGKLKTFSGTLLLIFAILADIANSAQISPTSLITFQNREQLDNEGKVWLGWEFDNETDLILFEMEVETTGYVGLGISPSSSMAGADIFIAGVFDNGTSYGMDCIGIGFTRPKPDLHADWVLDGAIEAVGKTFLKFSRLINTCNDEDYPIGVDTTRLIWAYGDTDDIAYHTMARRGAKAVNLIGTPIPDLDLEGLSKWEMTVDVEMPSLDTTYWCSYHKGPVLVTKHHVVGFDALLDNIAALAHTHHFILKNCYLPRNHNETLDEVFGPYTVDAGYDGGHCYDPESTIPPLEQYCSQDLFVWAKGGKIMTFPANVGYPLGEGENAGKQLYYMLEIHYDNPDEVAGLKFKTGVQFYYTDEIRQQDAGLLAVGHMTNPILTIPPNVDDFVLMGQCDPSCTEWGIKPEEGVTIFNALLHAHISGRKLKLRHFRGAVELPWIDYDDHYDFDYQQNKPIPGTQLLPRDRLIYECTYSSKWTDNTAVVGGMSSREEMCITFLWYYPRQDMTQCFSQTPFAVHTADFGITRVHDEDAKGGPQMFIDEPAYMAGQYRYTISLFNNWTESFVEQYQYNHRYLPHEGSCVQEDGQYLIVDETSYPEGMIKYVPKDVCEPGSEPTTVTQPETTQSPTTQSPTTQSPTSLTPPQTAPTQPQTTMTQQQTTPTQASTTVTLPTSTEPQGGVASGIATAKIGSMVAILTYIVL